MLGSSHYSSFYSFFKSSYIIAIVEVEVLFYRQLYKAILAKASNFYILLILKKNFSYLIL